jgi:hypothetical protein
MVTNTYLYENKMFTNKVNAIWVRKGKRVKLIKRVLLMQVLKEALEGPA